MCFDKLSTKFFSVKNGGCYLKITEVYIYTEPSLSSTKKS